MNQAFGTMLRVLAWALAIALVALPVVAVVNGWIGAERWPLRVLRVNERLEQVDTAGVRAALLQHAQRGFFAVDLGDAQRDVAKLPWVAGVEVRKKWPDVLEVRITEHLPFARWGDDKLLSTRGRLFAAEGIDAPIGMPRFDGPETRIAEIVTLYNESRDLFEGTGVEIAQVVLDARGSWQLTLSNGTRIIVGSQEARPRLARFARMLPRLISGRKDALARADLRYTNGFALVWATPGEAEAGANTPAPATQVATRPLEPTIRNHGPA